MVSASIAFPRYYLIRERLKEEKARNITPKEPPLSDIVSPHAPATPEQAATYTPAPPPGPPQNASDVAFKMPPGTVFPGLTK